MKNFIKLIQCNRSQLEIYIISALIIVMSFACVDYEVIEDNGDHNDKAYIKTSYLWTDASIPVCWENPSKKNN